MSPILSKVSAALGTLAGIGTSLVYLAGLTKDPLYLSLGVIAAALFFLITAVAGVLSVAPKTIANMHDYEAASVTYRLVRWLVLLAATAFAIVVAVVAFASRDYVLRPVDVRGPVDRSHREKFYDLDAERLRYGIATCSPGLDAGLVSCLLGDGPCQDDESWLNYWLGGLSMEFVVQPRPSKPRGLVTGAVVRVKKFEPLPDLVLTNQPQATFGKPFTFVVEIEDGRVGDYHAKFLSVPSEGGFDLTSATVPSLNFFDGEPGLFRIVAISAKTGIAEVDLLIQSEHDGVEYLAEVANGLEVMFVSSDVREAALQRFLTLDENQQIQVVRAFAAPTALASPVEPSFAFVESTISDAMPEPTEAELRLAVEQQRETIESLLGVPTPD